MCVQSFFHAPLSFLSSSPVLLGMEMGVIVGVDSALEVDVDVAVCVVGALPGRPQMHLPALLVGASVKHTYMR